MCDAMMGMIDVYPTVKRIAGITMANPNPLDGLDILDVIRGTAPSPKRYWFSYIAQGSPDKIAVCDGTWKLVVLGGSVPDVSPEAGTDTSDPELNRTVELYHMDRDPGETTNLAEEEPKIVSRLLAELQAFRRLKIGGIPDFRKGREGLSLLWGCS